MPKRARELTGVEIKRLTQPGWHAVGHVLGLGLQNVGPSARSWVLRVVDASGKRRAFGLGSYPTVDLDMARTKARQLREQVRAGADPVAEAKRAKREAARQAATFRIAAAEFLTARAAGWKNAKHAAQWESTLATYVFPRIGDLPVAEIVTADVLAVLQQQVPKKGIPKETGPLWVERTETAARVRQRIEAILDAAKARGLRAGDNPAAWQGNLEALLPKPGDVRAIEHHEALPWQDVPAFIRELRAREGMAARALEFAILTAARSGEVRGALWSEIDLDAALWIVPADRMKAKREHRVPLSPQAVELLMALPRTAELVFPAPSGKAMSDMTMSAVLKRMKVDATVHGFRSSFRDWAGEATEHAREVIEHALAHQLKDKAEAAYARGTLLDKRRALMTDWGAYCGAH